MSGTWNADLLRPGVCRDLNMDKGASRVGGRQQLSQCGGLWESPLSLCWVTQHPPSQGIFAHRLLQRQIIITHL